MRAQATIVIFTGLWLLTFCGLSVKVIADGYRSHAVNVQLKIVRYKWLSGNVRGATAVLWRTAPEALEAGWRWQVAQGYFLLALGHAQFGDSLRANELCQAGLAALGFGRYDHTRNGTSTTSRKCDKPLRQP
ncbi:MAG: hypothetical protein ACT4QE_04715 [Anaerolineales bacterium]